MIDPLQRGRLDEKIIHEKLPPTAMEITGVARE